MKKDKNKMKKWTPNRENLVNDGFYDGRFMNRVFEDKKKKANKKYCKKNIKHNDEF